MMYCLKKDNLYLTGNLENGILMLTESNEDLIIFYDETFDDDDCFIDELSLKEFSFSELEKCDITINCKELF